MSGLGLSASFTGCRTGRVPGEMVVTHTLVGELSQIGVHVLNPIVLETPCRSQESLPWCLKPLVGATNHPEVRLLETPRRHNALDLAPWCLKSLGVTTNHSMMLETNHIGAMNHSLVLETCRSQVSQFCANETGEILVGATNHSLRLEPPGRIRESQSPCCFKLLVEATIFCSLLGTLCRSHESLLAA